jgi:hypothetical protein
VSATSISIRKHRESLARAKNRASRGSEAALAMTLATAVGAALGMAERAGLPEGIWKDDAGKPMVPTKGLIAGGATLVALSSKGTLQKAAFVTALVAAGNYGYAAGKEMSLVAG